MRPGTLIRLKESMWAWEGKPPHIHYAKTKFEKGTIWMFLEFFWDYTKIDKNNRDGIKYLDPKGRIMYSYALKRERSQIFEKVD